jgi:hypothetical protein
VSEANNHTRRAADRRDAEPSVSVLEEAPAWLKADNDEL